MIYVNVILSQAFLVGGSLCVDTFIDYIVLVGAWTEAEETQPIFLVF